MEFTLSIGIHLPLWAILTLAPIVGTACAALFLRRRSGSQAFLRVNFATKSKKALDLRPPALRRIRHGVLGTTPVDRHDDCRARIDGGAVQ
jgi:hypothetical protein